MTNWYWPQWDGSWKYKLLAYFLNSLAKQIGFKESNANLHDKSYEKGGTERDRIEADVGFLERLLADSQGSAWKRLCAYLFYFTVRIFGKPSFNYKKEEKWMN